MRSRTAQVERLGNERFDVLVLGGGVTGVAAAHRLMARGYNVALIDDHDFASGTSQESSQLIWGGIKYLEQGRLKLVAQLCAARNRLHRRYPLRVEPLRFLYPHYAADPHPRPFLLAGGYLYWALGRGFHRRPRLRTNRDVLASVPALRGERLRGGLEYSDAHMVHSDARLVLDLLFDAMDQGLAAANYVAPRAFAPEASGEGWRLTAEDLPGRRGLDLRARWIVNTTGVWVDEVNDALGLAPPFRLLFSKGIHLIVRRIETGGRALTCRAADGRIFFVIPWGGVTLIGTTDTPLDGPPRRVRAAAEDIAYLRQAAEARLHLRLEDADVLNTKAGLRPLLRPARLKEEDFLSLARSHKVWSDPRARVTALWGGKYTDSFLMAEEIAAQVTLSPSHPPRPAPPVRSAEPAEDRWWWQPAADPGALAEVCRQELVVRLEDLLRRRTNQALHIPRGGWGADNENAPALARLADAVARANAASAPAILEDYRRTVFDAPTGDKPR